MGVTARYLGVSKKALETERHTNSETNVRLLAHAHKDHKRRMLRQLSVRVKIHVQHLRLAARIGHQKLRLLVESIGRIELLHSGLDLVKQRREELLSKSLLQVDLLSLLVVRSAN